MKLTLKKLHNQVMVITGASSGIGLVTARMAAKEGARLVLAARTEEALRQLTAEINNAGGEAIYVVADVSQPADVHRIAQVAIQRFGGFDTWVNDAGVSMYGKVEEMPIEDMRKLFDTNVWGLIYGSLEAVKHLKLRGGTLINIGSVLSEATAILQTVYSASKHAVKGFTDGLRMELEMEGAPVAVSLIKPAAIDTPYTLHAKNFMDREPQHAPPAYAPEIVADAILHCAETGQAEVTVGGGGKAITTMAHYAPRLTDKFMEKVFSRQSKAARRAQPRSDNGLDHAAAHLEERGNYPGHTRETSIYTAATTHPLVTAAVLAGAGVGLAAVMSRSGKASAGKVKEPQS
ncbi:SDR family oxidoreductase [Hymenobacter sp. BT770]|uniref:SDR family oxidoreductase n=1 Tax=Hymenobacter sp. BT770 TaxID=2886942 RepID=UPI001D10EF82|nr:SDR family oxidoreductase [Hymenobacter sp. BT770]MCC3154557.1 SDR family oxidoreductase [Hymenobacter sp. BT770]MDO3416611.1 SDR family oxidoreductase [Hymenobacter sp. BT770]